MDRTEDSNNSHHSVMPIKEINTKSSKNDSNLQLLSQTNHTKSNINNIIDCDLESFTINDTKLYIKPGVKKISCITYADAKGIVGPNYKNYKSLIDLIPEEYKHKITINTTGKNRVFYPLITEEELREQQDVIILEDSDGEEVIEETDDNDSTKQFKLNLLTVHLTYKTHLNKLRYLEYVKNLIETTSNYTNKVLHYSIVNESADSKNNYKHTHAAFSFLHTLTITSPNFFDYDDIHPHIKVPMQLRSNYSSRHSGGFGYICVEYHTKENNSSRISNYPVASIPHYNKKKKLVGYYPSEGDLLQINNRQDAAAIAMQAPTYDSLKVTKIYNDSKLAREQNSSKRPMKLNNLYECQNHILNLINSDCNDRTVIWIVDEEGCNGKSVICEYLEEKNCISTTFGGKYKDAAHSLSKMLDINPNPKAIIFDVSKSTKSNKNIGNYSNNCKLCVNHVDDYENILETNMLNVSPKFNNPELYKLLEDIKNSKFNSDKFDSKLVKLPRNTPVVVMSNKHPITSCLSHDRWIICSIDFQKKLNIQVYSNSGIETVERANSSMKLINNEFKEPQRILCNSKEQLDNISNLIGRDVMVSFWDKYKIPIFNVKTIFECEFEKHPESCKLLSINEGPYYSINIRCRDMTEKEKENYNKSKNKHPNALQDNPKKNIKMYRGVEAQLIENNYETWKDGLLKESNLSSTARAYFRDRDSGLTMDEIIEIEKEYK